MAVVSSTSVSASKPASQESLKYSVFPNPVQSVLNVEMATSETVTLMILNQLGQVVLQQQTSEKLFSIPVDKLHEGVYYMAVINQGGLLRTQRFVKKGRT
jgi:hypothetical protein